MKLINYISIFVILQLCSSKASAQTGDTVCSFTKGKVYRVVPTPGSIYYWSVECGKIVSPNVNADSIVVNWCQTPGTYQITVIERNRYGCWGDTIRAWTTVGGKLNMSINGPTEICEGEPVRLQASGAINYIWSTGETTQSVIEQPKDSAKYMVVGKNACNADTAYINVKVDARPKASFTYNPPNPMVDETVFFHYTGTGAVKWEWFFGDKNALDAQITDPEYSFNLKGDKLVTLVAANGAGCTDTITYNLHVTYDAKIFVPNSFTPNGDGVNDVFKAVGYNIESIHTQIYNRWGEMIFESFGVNDAWDGTYKGEKVIEGVYIYKIEARATDAEPFYLNGNITVLY